MIPKFLNHPDRAVENSALLLKVNVKERKNKNTQRKGGTEIFVFKVACDSLRRQCL